MLPEEIEKRSFEIIDAEAGRHGFPSREWTIVRRMIHTSADFEYLTAVRIHPGEPYHCFAFSMSGEIFHRSFPAVSSICQGFLAPTIAEVTSGRRNTQAMAS